MQGRMVRVALAVLVLAAMGFSGWQWIQWYYPHITLDPEAEIDPERNYTINVWVERGRGLVKMPALEAEFWSQVTSDFKSVYPNTEIVLKEVPAPDLEREMKEALNRGRPPNVLVASSQWFRCWSELQLPIDRFLPEGEREGYVLGALQKVTVGENLMAWPSHIQPRLWAANRKELGKLSSDLASLLEEWKAGTLWFGDDLQAARDKLLKLKDVGENQLAHQFGSSATLVDLSVALGGGLIGPKGELLLTKELLTSLVDLWQALRDERVLELVQGTLLTDFFSGRRMVIGPVGLWIWTLEEEAALRGYRALSVPQDVILLPPPGGNGENCGLLGTTVEVAVFRQRPFQGPAQARLSMEFARDLSRKLGLELSITGLGAPAYKPLWDEWQSALGWGPDQRVNLEEVLESMAGLPPLNPKWHEARRRLIGEVLIPGFDDFVNGKVGPEIAEKLDGEMRTFLAGIQGRRSQGKQR
ncbi:MAG: hypothetical protein GX047_07960 [Firmicutes bacterium]|nr:hypothetical protein [Bacillota bacterium]